MTNSEKVLSDMEKLRERKAFVIWDSIELIFDILEDYILPDNDYRTADLRKLKNKVAGYLTRELLEHHDDDTNV